MKFLATLLFSLFVFAASAQLNLTELSVLPYADSSGNHVELSDVWGYADEMGNEYALVGAHNGFSIVDVTDPANPNLLFFEEGNPSTWRDMKTWGDYAYCVTEGGNGLLIVDMTPLPQSTNLDFTYYFGDNYPFSSVHNIWIDENGVAYLFGANFGEGGAIMLDLTNDPDAPEEIGIFDQFYIHDGFVRGDTMWVGAINDGFAGAVDVSDKSNPVVLGTWDTPNLFSHNIWPSDDGETVYTTDEVGGAFIGSYDVTDLSNVEELDRIQSSPGSGVIPHNTHFLNKYLITSYYSDGVHIVDAARPHNLIEVGNYDTSPNFAGWGFNGAWGAYPYLPSGNILVADIEEGLVTLAPIYIRGAYLEGTVTDPNCNVPLNDVEVEIIGLGIVDQSHPDGAYATGTAQQGTFDVRFSKPGYQTHVETGVSFVNGVLTPLDVQLTPVSIVAIDGTVDHSGNPLQGADVIFAGDSADYVFVTDSDGELSKCNVVMGDYTVTVAKWGWVSECFDITVDASNTDFDFSLERGYYDDFTTDFGWVVSGDASDGTWQRGEPNGTQLGDDIFNPDQDVTNDCSGEAYVTGNGGGSAGEDDIDGGATILRSPVLDLTIYTEPYIEYNWWFANGGGNGEANDNFRAYIMNSTDTVLLEQHDTNSVMHTWNFSSWRVEDYLPISDDLQLLFIGEDIGPGHLVEVGIDRFAVVDSSDVAIGIATTAADRAIYAYPNPFEDQLTISLDEDVTNANAVLYDLLGNVVAQQRITQRVAQLNVGDQLAGGVYLLRVTSEGRQLMSQPVIKR